MQTEKLATTKIKSLGPHDMQHFQSPGAITQRCQSSRGFEKFILTKKALEIWSNGGRSNARNR